MPPLNVRLLDHRSFGLKPLVGTHTVQSMKIYRRDPVAQYNAIKQRLLKQSKLTVPRKPTLQIESRFQIILRV